MSTVAFPFLGAGIVRPFRRGASDVSNSSGLLEVQASVSQCLGTRKGELRWRRNFGSELYRLKHRKGPALPALAGHFVADALKWEPRVILKSVDAYYGPPIAAGQAQPAALQSIQQLTIDLLYDVISANVPGNQVLFADVQQTVSVPILS